MVTTSIETYFWMVDRLQMEDDSRNKVNMTKNTVSLSKHFLKRIENGHYIGRLCNEMYQTYTKRSGKTFSIPQEINDIDPETAVFHAPTWAVIFDTLSEFGIALSKQK